jgi:hypothetical protein
MLKRLIFYSLKQREQIEPLRFARSRKIYFGFLALTVWMLIFGYWTFITEQVSEVFLPFASIIGISIPTLIAVFFYFLCVRLFVTRPLRSIQSGISQASPQDLNNGSSG